MSTLLNKEILLHKTDTRNKRKTLEPCAFFKNKNIQQKINFHFWTQSKQKLICFILLYFLVIEPYFHLLWLRKIDLIF